MLARRKAEGVLLVLELALFPAAYYLTHFLERYRFPIEPVLVLCSGANTVDARRLGLDKADADLVRRATGFAIGGVPPYGHPAPLETLVDEDLLGYDEIWAAGGVPQAVFPITYTELVRITDGRAHHVA